MIPDRLFDLAFRFRKEKIWSKLYDTELFALRHADGSIGYCSVMGTLGSFLALAVYPGEQGLETLRITYQEQSCFNNDEDEPRETMLTNNCYVVSFENKGELDEPEEVCAYCAVHGLSPRGKKAFPEFKRHLPYRLPWRLEDEDEQIRLADALEAGLEVAKRLKKETKEALGFSIGELYYRQIPLLEKKGDAYTWDRIPLPGPIQKVYPSPDVQDELLLKKLSATKKRSGEWACDILLHPEAITADGDECGYAESLVNAPFYPHVMLIVNPQTGIIISAEISPVPEKFGDSFAHAVLDLALKIGKPTQILVSNNRAYAFFSKLATHLNAKLVMEKTIPMLAEAVEGFLSHHRQEDREEIGEENLQEILAVLQDPGRLCGLPDEALVFLAKITNMSGLPEEVTKPLRQVCKNRNIPY